MEDTPDLNRFQELEAYMLAPYPIKVEKRKPLICLYR